MAVWRRRLAFIALLAVLLGTTGVVAHTHGAECDSEQHRPRECAACVLAAACIATPPTLLLLVSIVILASLVIPDGPAAVVPTLPLHFFRRGPPTG